jgi:putative membrane protein
MNHKKLTGMAAMAVAGLLTAMTAGAQTGTTGTGTTGTGTTGGAMGTESGTTGSGSGSGSMGTSGSMGSMGHDNMGKGGMGKMSAADKKFMMNAAMGGMEEVEMGKLAASNATNADVKAFGQRMVDDHTKANDQLKQLAQTKGVTLPTDMSKAQHADMTKLGKMTGDAFDHAYVKMMVKDHKKDVAEFQMESMRGADADIKSFATRTLPTLQEHLQMIQRIDDKMKLRKSGNLKNMNSNSNM